MHFSGQLKMLFLGGRSLDEPIHAHFFQHTLKWACLTDPNPQKRDRKIYELQSTLFILLRTKEKAPRVSSRYLISFGIFWWAMQEWEAPPTPTPFRNSDAGNQWRMSSTRKSGRRNMPGRTTFARIMVTFIH
jgi:hypothetical protein